MEIKNTLIELKRDKNDLGVNGEEGLGWLNVCQLSYARKVFNKNRQQGKKKSHFHKNPHTFENPFSGCGGKCLQGNQWFSPRPSMTSRLFQNGEQSVHRRGG